MRWHLLADYRLITQQTIPRVLHSYRLRTQQTMSRVLYSFMAYYLNRKWLTHSVHTLLVPQPKFDPYNMEQMWAMVQARFGLAVANYLGGSWLPDVACYWTENMAHVFVNI